MRGLGDTQSIVGAASVPAPPVGSSVQPTQSLTATLREAVERHGERVVLLCSFQKEESVLIDELLRIDDGATQARIVTIDTGVLFEETLQTWRAFEERFGVAVEVYDASRLGEEGGALDRTRALLLAGEGRRAGARAATARRAGSRASAASRGPRARRPS